MADKKISQLTAATTPLAGTEVLPIVQSSTTKQVSVANLTAGRSISATQFTASTENFVVGTAGKGIDFSANSGTVLDQYRVGTWTPTILGDTGTVTSYIAQQGRYTKIGRLVYVSFHVSLSDKGTISGEARLGGLPFTTVNAGTQSRGPLSISIWEDLATAKAWVALYTIPNTTTAYFVASGGAVVSSENAMNTSAIGNTTVFVGSGIYEASA